MLLHNNNIFFVIQKLVVEFHIKVKCISCIFYVKYIFVMAESDKTLIKESNLSNNNRNVSSVPTTTPLQGHPETHPTHHAAVSEPSTLKRKQNSFQITSVTVKGSRLSTDGGEDSADDLDESHTEDASSDILDCSRTTDVDISEENALNHDDAPIFSPSIANKCKVGFIKPEMFEDALTGDIHKPVCSLLTSERPSGLPDQWQHRFRVVKIVSSEPFKRGRWLCMDFMDPPPAPITEAKAEEIVETAANSNIHLLTSSLSEAIPGDKIAHIYEISPSDAYPGSISVSAGSEHTPAPLYGIFLPINNGQYPLITGMHSRAIHAIEREVRINDVVQTNQNVTPPTTHSVSGQQNSSLQQNQAVHASVPSQNVAAQQPQNTSANLPPQSHNATSISQSENTGVHLTQSPMTTANMQSSQNLSANVQPNTNSQQSTSNLQPIQNAMSSIPQSCVATPSTNVSMQQSHSLPVASPVPTTAPQSQSMPVATQSTNTSVSQQPTIPMTVQNAPVQQLQNVSANMQPVQNAPAAVQPMQNNVAANLQPAQNTSVAVEPVQNASANSQLVQNTGVAAQPVQHVSANLQPVQNTPASLPLVSNVSNIQSGQTGTSSLSQLPNPSSNSEPPPISPQVLSIPPAVQPANPIQNLSYPPNAVQQGSGNNAPLPMNAPNQPPPAQESQPSIPPTNTTVAPAGHQGISETEGSSISPMDEAQAHPPAALPMSVQKTSTVGTQAAAPSIPESVTPDTLSSQVVQNHVEGTKELGTPPLQENTSDSSTTKTDVNGEESESVPSGTSTVAIDNKIEQAMDLVKSHLMFAVREEVDVLKEKITELMDRISQLEYENGFLRANATPETLDQLNQTQLLQQQNNIPSTVSINSISQVSQQPIQQQHINIQNQQPTS